MSTNGQNNGDIRATLAISQAEAQYGTTRTLTLPGKRQVTVQVPAGTTTGQVIRIEGEGEPGASGNPAGTLILTISVAPAENFGYQPYPAAEQNFPTELVQAPLPPPPPPSTEQAFHPTVEQREGYTNYPPQGQLYPTSPPSAQAPTIPSYPPYSQSAPQQPRRRSTGLVAVLIILVLALIVGSLATFYVGVYQPAQLHAQATSTAIAKVTGTAQAQANATAQVEATRQAQTNATATAQTLASNAATATVTALQANYSQIVNSSPTLNDPLSTTSASGWIEGPECGYTNNAYHAKETQSNILLYCAASKTNFSNFVYRVRMTIVSGQRGGMIFRADATNSKFYLFRVAQDGTYDLYMYPDKTGTNARKLTSGTATNMHTEQNASNLLAVVAHGSEIDLYINDRYQASANDSTFQSGAIGLVAENDGPPVDMAYTQAQVWRLP
jgi:hypothetical protein